MNNGFIQLNRSQDTLDLIKSRPTAFLLLTIIALRARRTDKKFGLEINQALVGDWKNYTTSEQTYRSDKNYLTTNGLANFKSTNRGTIATLTNTSIFDINSEQSNEQLTSQLTGQQRTTNEPTNSPLTTNNKEINKERKKEIKLDFELFWKEYPRKETKKKALDIWNKMKVQAQQDALVGLRKQLPAMTKKDKQYIPMATTWLNQARWEDEIAPANNLPVTDLKRWTTYEKA